MPSPASLSLVPIPPRPGLYVILGPPDVIPWALESMTRVFSPQPIVWIDAANRFNAHWVSITARSVYKDAAAVLSSYHVARPFTAYQLEAMVTQKLLPATQRYHSLFSVIADPLGLYEGAEGRDTQVRHSFQRFIEGVRRAAARTPLVLLIPDRHTTGDPARRTCGGPEPGPQRYFSALMNAATSQRRLETRHRVRELIEVH